MSTAVVNESAASLTTDFQAFQPGGRQAEILRSNLGGETVREKDLIKVGTPLGGSTTWNVEVAGNVESTDEIVGLLVGECRRGYLWPTAELSNEQPVIQTNDFVTGYRVGSDLGDIDPEALERFRTGDRTYDWAAMSTSAEFGFGSRGSSKRVKEGLQLAVLRKGDTLPIIVKLSATSMANWRKVRMNFKSLPYETIIGLKLTRVKAAAGHTYSQVVARIAGCLSVEQGAVAKELYWDPINAMLSAPPVQQAFDADLSDE